MDHVKTISPISHNISAGAAYGDYNIEVGLEVGEDGSGSYSGKSYMLWGVDAMANKNQKIGAEFIIRKGHGQNLDYTLHTKLEIPYLDPIQVGGTLLINPHDKSTFALNWANGYGQNYTLDLNYKAVNHKYDVNALLRMNDLLYKADIALQNDDTKKVQIDLVANKHYYLNVNATNMFRNVGFEFFWDMDNDKTKSLVFEATATTDGQHPTVFMSFNLLGHDGTFKGLLKPTGIESDINYNGDKVEAKLQYDYSDGAYGFNADLKSSIALIQLINFSANLKNTKEHGKLESAEIFLNAKWNDHFEHSISADLQKAGVNKVAGNLKTTSTHTPFNGIASRFLYSQTDLQLQVEFELLKESNQHVKLIFKQQKLHGNNPIRKGALNLESSSELVKKFVLNYQLELGQEIHFKGDADYNQGHHKIDADVKVGGFQSNERKLEFKIDHTWGEQIKGSLQLRGNDFSKNMFVASKLFYGKCGFNLENDYASSYQTDIVGLRPKNRDDALSIQSKFFLGCTDKKPIDFMMNLKSVDKYEQSNNFIRKRDVSAEQVLKIGNDKITNLEFHAKALHNTIEDIKIDGDILDGKHKINFVAKQDFTNTREYGIDSDFSYLFQGQTHSKANVNWSKKHLASSSDVIMLFQTGFETSLLRNKKYSIKFSHDTSSNWQKIKTILTVIPGDQAKKFEATNEATWKVVDEMISFNDGFDVVTPFEYMKSVELDLDGTFQKNAVIDAKGKGKWNSKEVELKVQVDKEHSKPGNVIYKVEGKYNQKRIGASFSITKKDYTPNTDWKGDKIYELKFLDPMGHESTIKITPWKENDYTFKLAAKLPPFVLKHPVKIFQNVAFENNDQCSFEGKVIYGTKDYLDLKFKVQRSMNSNSRHLSVEGQFKSPGFELNGWDVKGHVNYEPQTYLPISFGRRNTLSIPFKKLDAKLDVADLKRNSKLVGVQLNFSHDTAQGSQIKALFSSAFLGFEDLKLEGQLEPFRMEKISGMMKFEKNGKNVFFKISNVINSNAVSKFETTITTTLFSPKFQKASFVVQYDASHKSWVIEGGFNKEKISFFGNFEKALDAKTVKASLESSYHSFKRIDMNGALKTENNGYIFTFNGEAADSTNKFDIKATISAMQGDISVQIKLPFLSLDNEIYNIKYTMDQPTSNIATGGRLEAEFNGKNYKLNWLKTKDGLMAIDLLTPIPSFKKVSIEHKMSSEYRRSFFSQSIFPVNAEFNFKSKVNDHDWLIVDFDYMENNNASFRLVNHVLGGLLREVVFDFEAVGRKVAHLSFKGALVNFSILGELAEFYEDAFLTMNTTSTKYAPIVFKTGYDLHRKVYLDLEGFGEHVILNVNKTPDTFEIQASSIWSKTMRLLATGTKIFGHIPSSILIEHKSSPIFKFDVRHEKISDSPRSIISKGKLKVDVYHPTSLPSFPSGFRDFEDSSLALAYDLQQPTRKLQIKLSHGSKFFTVQGKFKNTEDTFDGEFAMKSSVAWLNGIKLGLKYNISAKPSVDLVVVRNGKRHAINIEVTFDGLIPTVTIKTPFVGYEKIVFSGTYKANNNKKIIDISLNINGKEMVRLINHVSANDDYTKFGLRSTLTTDASGKLPEQLNDRNMHIEVEYSAVDPYSAKVKLMDGDVEYSARGSLSFVNKEFNIHAVTPIVGYEFITFGGKFGSTATGQHFGMSFQQNREKRELAFEYDSKDGLSQMSIKTPMRQIRSVSASVNLPSGIDQPAKFDFETDGESHSIAFGLQFKFKQTAQDGCYGNFQAKFLNSGKESSLVLDYKLKDFIMDKGFDITLDIRPIGKQILLELKQTNEFTRATIQTDYVGFEKLSAEFKTDFFKTSPPTTASIELSHDNKAFGLYLQKNPDKVDITFVTPFVEYNKFIISLMKDAVAKSGTIDIKKYNEMGTETKVFKITASVDLYPDGLNIAHPVHLIKVKKFNVNGRVDIEQQGFWTTFKLTGDMTDITSLPFTLELKSSSPKLNIFELSATVKPSASNKGTGQLKLDVKYNDKTLNYVSKLTTSDDSVKASSTLQTNIQELGFEERKSNYELSKTRKQESNGPLDTYTLKYQQEDNGVKKIDIHAQATSKIMKFSRVTLKLSVFWPELTDSQDKIQAALEVSGKPGEKASFNFKLQCSFGEKKLKAKFEMSMGENNGRKFIRADTLLYPENIEFVPKVKIYYKRIKKTEYYELKTHEETHDFLIRVNDMEIARAKLTKNYEKDTNSQLMMSNNIILDSTFFKKTKQKLEFKFVRVPEDFKQELLIQASGSNKYTSGKIHLTSTNEAHEGEVVLLIDGFTLPDYDTIVAKPCSSRSSSPLWIRPLLENYCIPDAFKWLPRSGPRKLQSLKLKTSWSDEYDDDTNDKAFQIFLGGQKIFTSEFSAGHPNDYDELIVTSKVVDKKMLLAYIPPIYLPLKYLGFIEFGDVPVSNLIINHKTTINSDSYLKEYEIATNAEIKVDYEGSTHTVYKRDGKITWSPEKSNIDLTIQNDFFGSVHINGQRTGPVGLLIYPFYTLLGGELYGRTRSPNFYFNKQSAMNAKYSIDFKGGVACQSGAGCQILAMESDVNIKNVKEHEFNWKVSTPTQKSLFKELKFSGKSVLNNNDKERIMDNVYEMKGRSIFLSGPYDPSFVDKITEKVTYIKHAERLNSGNRQYDNYLVEYTTTIPGFETITISRKADLDGDAFVAANRVSPVTTKLTWPGHEIKLVENVVLDETNVKVKGVLTTTYESLKKIEYTFEHLGLSQNVDIKYEGMGGYVNWNRQSKMQKDGKQFDAEITFKSSWVESGKEVIIFSTGLWKKYFKEYKGFHFIFQY